MSNEPIELETVPYDKTMYPHYKVRIGAALLDLLIIAPFSILVLYINSLSLEMYYYTAIPSLAFSAWYHVYLLKRYGATPGKLISGIRVVKTNGQDPEWKDAFLRHAVLLGFMLFGFIIGLVALSQASPDYYRGLSWRQQREHLHTLAPDLFTVNTWLYNIWALSELMIMLINRRKRALHDLMAGTVVVRDLYMKRLRLYRSEEENALNKPD